MEYTATLTGQDTLPTAEGWFALNPSLLTVNGNDGIPTHLNMVFIRKRRGGPFVLKLKLAAARCLANAIIAKLDSLEGIT